VADDGGTLIVNLSINGSYDGKSGDPPVICDKTAGEIYEAFRNGNVKFIFNPEDYYEEIINLIYCVRVQEGYHFMLANLNYNLILDAATANDYPTNGEPESDEEPGSNPGQEFMIE